MKDNLRPFRDLFVDTLKGLIYYLNTNSVKLPESAWPLLTQRYSQVRQSRHVQNWILKLIITSVVHQKKNHLLKFKKKVREEVMMAAQISTILTIFYILLDTFLSLPLASSQEGQISLIQKSPNRTGNHTAATFIIWIHVNQIWKKKGWTYNFNVFLTAH